MVTGFDRKHPRSVILIRVLVTAWLLALTGILLAYGYWGWALLTLAGAAANSVLAYRVFRATKALARISYGRFDTTRCSGFMEVPDSDLGLPVTAKSNLDPASTRSTRSSRRIRGPPALPAAADPGLLGECPLGVDPRAFHAHLSELSADPVDGRDFVVGLVGEGCFERGLVRDEQFAGRKLAWSSFFLSTFRQPSSVSRT